MPKRKAMAASSEACKRNDVVSKYRRQSTLVNKMLELSEQSQLKINLVVYDPKYHRMEEIWSHGDFRL